MFTFLPRVYMITFDFSFVCILLWDEWFLFYFAILIVYFTTRRLVVNHQRKSRTPADRNYEPYGLQRSVICVNNTICLEIRFHRLGNHSGCFSVKMRNPNTQDGIEQMQIQLLLGVIWSFSGVQKEFDPNDLSKIWKLIRPVVEADQLCGRVTLWSKPSFLGLAIWFRTRHVRDDHHKSIAWARCRHSHHIPLFVSPILRTNDRKSLNLSTPTYSHKATDNLGCS